MEAVITVIGKNDFLLSCPGWEAELVQGCLAPSDHGEKQMLPRALCANRGDLLMRVLVGRKTFITSSRTLVWSWSVTGPTAPKDRKDPATLPLPTPVTP